ncbi:hypothetical protein LP420_29355 [Massilia sp. B-10]|nr:hypothetical protein LP420_29355 [Massilia sp. B-10]
MQGIVARVDDDAAADLAGVLGEGGAQVAAAGACRQAYQGGIAALATVIGEELLDTRRMLLVAVSEEPPLAVRGLACRRRR